MKKLLINNVILLALLFTFSKASAQVNINIGLQPVWGPVGYDYVEYYYFPEYEMYYYVPQRQYVYMDGGNWVFVNSLPPRIRTVNLYSTYKVVVNQPKAYLHFNEHRVEYVKYKHGGGNQVVIRDSRDPKYFVIKDHPMHGKARDNEQHNQQHQNVKGNAEHGNGRGKEMNKGNHAQGAQPHHEQHTGNGGNGQGGNGGGHHGKGGK